MRLLALAWHPTAVDLTIRSRGGTGVAEVLTRFTEQGRRTVSLHEVPVSLQPHVRLGTRTSGKQCSRCCAPSLAHGLYACSASRLTRTAAWCVLCLVMQSSRLTAHALAPSGARTSAPILLGDQVHPEIQLDLVSAEPQGSGRLLRHRCNLVPDVVEQQRVVLHRQSLRFNYSVARYWASSPGNMVGVRWIQVQDCAPLLPATSCSCGQTAQTRSSA